MERKRAVLVGIDDYERPLTPLGGCVKDVELLLPLLQRNDDGSSNFECREFTSANGGYVGRPELLRAVETAFAPGVGTSLFYFAGHGMYERNDAVLVSQDGKPGNLGVRFSEVLAVVQDAKIDEVMLILDCCYSGDAGGNPLFGGGAVALRKGVSILTASRADQGAAELVEGIFSGYLRAALAGGAADVLGQVTLASVYAYVSESFGAFAQRPTFKANVTFASNVEELHVLRECSPSLPRAAIRGLTQIFKQADAELPLDPAYEPTSDVPEDKAKRAVFAILQQCRAARLVEPVGAAHLYYAAMDNKSCRLTPLGRHYWAVADRL